MTSRIAVTGVGALSAHGHLDDPDFASVLGAKGLRGMSRESKLLACAAATARDAAALGHSDCPPERLGVVVGTVFSGVDEFVEYYASGLADGFDRVNPARGPLTSWNAPASQLSLRHAARAVNLTVSSGTASSIDAVGVGCRHLDDGLADVLLAGGIDLLSPAVIAAYAGASSPTERARPFDRCRDGIVLGEAAVVFVLEAVAAARRRGAPIVADIAGIGASFAIAIEPDDLEEAAYRAMRTALGAAGCDDAAIDVVFASAAGDRIVDAAEALAIQRLFRSPLTCAIKGAVGECHGASGALQMAAAIEWLQSGVVPATAGFSQPDNATAGLVITTTPISAPGDRAIVTTLDRHGHAAAIVLERPRPAPVGHGDSDGR